MVRRRSASPVRLDGPGVAVAIGIGHQLRGVLVAESSWAEDP